MTTYGTMHVACVRRHAMDEFTECMEQAQACDNAVLVHFIPVFIERFKATYCDAGTGQLHSEIAGSEWRRIVL